jgi:SIR2-like domain
MFDASDPQTIKAVRALRAVVAERTRPLILWLGAGVSRWCGYPGWEQLAISFHSTFLRRASKYDKDLANKLLKAGDFPAFFQVCKSADAALYNSLLVESFGAPRPTPLFDRLIQLLSSISPLSLMTTNVDEALEKRLNCITVQRSDIERVPSLINAGTSFVCKLHGTISSVETTVFTSDEYLSLIENKAFLSAIQQVFALGSVVFLAYPLWFSNGGSFASLF